jgi:hypothetical protein
MNAVRRLRRWCPQPKTPIAINANKLYLPIITFVVIAEIFLLLVAPLAYFALLAPKPDVKLWESYPLTDDQIRQSWPNLPTAQQIVANGTYGIFDTISYILLPNSTAHTFYYQSIPHWWQNASDVMIMVIENSTVTNVPSMLRGGLIPVAYHIFLQTSNTTWIDVPQTYLTNSSHPPTIPSDVNNGFLGTNLPTIYVIAAIAIISITVVISASYLANARIKQQHNLA